MDKQKKLNNMVFFSTIKQHCLEMMCISLFNVDEYEKIIIKLFCFLGLNMKMMKINMKIKKMKMMEKMKIDLIENYFVFFFIFQHYKY